MSRVKWNGSVVICFNDCIKSEAANENEIEEI